MKKLTTFTLITLAIVLSGCTINDSRINNSNQPLTNKNTNNAIANNNSNENTNPNIINNINNDQIINDNQNTNNEPIVDPLVNLKTFTNKAGGYNFKYDPSWNAAISKYNNKETLFGPNANTSSGLGGVEVRDFNGSLNEYIKYLEKNVEIKFTSKQNITVNGLSAMQVDYTGVATQVGHGVYIQNGNQIINVYINNQDKKNIELFNKLLSTFGLNK